jgi:hypothetical protein
MAYNNNVIDVLMTYNKTVIHVLMTCSNQVIHVLMIYNNTAIDVLMISNNIVIHVTNIVPLAILVFVGQFLKKNSSETAWINKAKFYRSHLWLPCQVLFLIG